MYFKVALIASMIVLFSGCSNPLGPKPSNPNANKKLGVEVVEEVSPNESTTSTTRRSTVKRESVKSVKKDSVKKDSDKKSKTRGKKTTKTRKSKKPTKTKLKPEPFSLESNEEDPELLGPQSTIDNPLSRDEERSKESNTTAS